MKLSAKIILPIILISALLILLTGCFGVPDDSPEYTPSSITGIIAAPYCSTSATTVSEDIAPSDWCLQCEVDWFFQNQIEVVLTYGGEEIDSTTTNENGEYSFNDVPPGKYYIITAICPDDGGKPLVKDLIEEITEGEDYNAGITDGKSTTLALVVEALLDLGLNSEDIEAALEMIEANPKFTDLVDLVCDIIESCENLTTSNEVIELVEDIIDDEPGYTCAYNTPPILTVPANATVNPGIHYVGNASATDDDILGTLTFSLASISPEPTNDLTIAVDGTITWNPDCADIAGGTDTVYTVTIGVSDGCDETTDSFTITLNAEPCGSCYGNTAPTLIVPANTTINPGTHYIGTASATDDDILGTLTFNLVSVSPEPTNDLTIAVDGTITWNPDCADIAGGTDTVYTVTIGVSDGCDETTDSFTITLNAEPCGACYGNTAPTLIVPANTNVNPGTHYIGTASATDDDILGTLTFSASVVPISVNPLSINSSTGEIIWDPICEDIKNDKDTIYTVIVNVSDGCTNVQGSFKIILNAAFCASPDICEECEEFYVVALSVDPEGAGTTTGGGIYYADDSVDILATTNPGYTFVNWTDDDGGAVVSTDISHTFSMPAENLNYTANFEAIGYTVALSDNPAGAAATLTGGGSYNYNDSVTIAATEATGYAFVNWTDDDDGGAVVSTDISHTFSMPAENLNYTANFEAIGYTVALSDNPAGAAATLTGGGSYNYNDSVTIAATEATGYAFVNWTDDDDGGAVVSTDISHTFSMPAENLNYTANFEAIGYTVALSDNPAGAAATLTGGGSYNYNDSVTIAATEATGYAFVNWTDDDDGGAVVSTDISHTFSMPAENLNYTANFEAIGYTVALSDNPAGAAATLTGGGSYNYNDSVTIAATEATGYAFVNWTDDDDGGAVVSTDISHTFSMPAENLNYTANFEAIGYTVALSDNPAGAAATLTGGGSYNYNDSVTIAATEATGYAFVNWTDDDDGGAVVSTDISHTFSMPAENLNYTANFEAIGYTVALSDNPAGAAATLTGGGSYNYNDSVTIAATEATGYAFVNWTDDDDGGAVVSTDISHTFSMPAENLNYTANFEAIGYTVALSDNPAGAAATLTGGGSYNYNDSVTIAATEATGYAFVNWTDDDDGGAVVSTDISHTFSMPAENLNYTANFEAIGYTVALSDNPAGAAATLTGGGSYNYNDSVTIAATEATGYAFVNWTDDDDGGAVVSTDISHTFSMPAENLNYTANFEAIGYTVALSDNPAGAAATLTGGGSYNYNDSVTIAATEATGYAFVNWTDDDDGGAVVSTDISHTFSMPAENLNYTANFEQLIVIEQKDLHANLSKKDVVTEDGWNLHVWANITNASSGVFEGSMKIRSFQASSGRIEVYSSSITITIGKGRYPVSSDYWLMTEVGTGSAPKDVFVEIWIYDNGNEIAYTSKYAN